MRRDGVNSDNLMYRHFVVKQAEVKHKPSTAAGRPVNLPKGHRRLISIRVENPVGLIPAQKATFDSLGLQLSDRVVVDFCLSVKDLAVNRVSLPALELLFWKC